MEKDSLEAAADAWAARMDDSGDLHSPDENPPARRELSQNPDIAPDVEADSDDGPDDSPIPEGAVEYDPEKPIFFGVGEDGEPVVASLGALVEMAQQVEGLKASVSLEVENVRRQELEAVASRLSQMDQYFQQQAAHLSALMQSVPIPEQPNIELLNANSANYNPDLYHMQMRAYEHASATYSQAQRMVQQNMAQAEHARQQAMEQTNQKSAQQILALWPQMGDANYVQNFVAAAENLWGITEADLASGFDPRFFAVLKDALAYHLQKASMPKTQQKLSNSAPRISQGAANQKHAKAQADNKAAARLKQTGNVQDAAALFEKFYS